MIPGFETTPSSPSQAVKNFRRPVGGNRHDGVEARRRDEKDFRRTLDELSENPEASQATNGASKASPSHAEKAKERGKNPDPETSESSETPDRRDEADGAATGACADTAGPPEEAHPGAIEDAAPDGTEVVQGEENPAHGCKSMSEGLKATGEATAWDGGTTAGKNEGTVVVKTPPVPQAPPVRSDESSDTVASTSETAASGPEAGATAVADAEAEAMPAAALPEGESLEGPQAAGKRPDDSKQTSELPFSGSDDGPVSASTPNRHSVAKATRDGSPAEDEDAPVCETRAAGPKDQADDPGLSGEQDPQGEGAENGMQNAAKSSGAVDRTVGPAHGDSPSVKDSAVTTSRFESQLNTRLEAGAQQGIEPQSLDEMVEKAAWSARNGRSEVQIALKPDHLGHVRMMISAHEQQVSIRILTDVPVARDLLETHLHQLRQDIENQGMRVEQMDVLVAGEEHHAGSQHQAREHAARRMIRGPRYGNNRGDTAGKDLPGIVRTGQAGRASSGIDYFA
ncbi:MAG: flagellar hook-length control protein FliK [Desulfobacterales bacterium]